ncbi:MAG: site-2 protease family protein [Elusimicrobiales bacterium]|jgi:Zn-dependent protease
MEWLIQFPVLIFSIIFHEFAHGAAAYRKGDDTAYLSGRLTLNPLPHLDLIGSLLIPAICVMSHLPAIGWAKPVPINPLRMPRPRRDMAIVAMSGPVSNLILAVISLFVYKVFALGFLGGDLTLTLLKACSWGIIINLLLATFNLIPIYPLDGSQIALGFLPDKWLEVYEKHLPYGMYIVLGLVVTGAVQWVIRPLLGISLFFLDKLGIVIVI